MDPVWTLPLLTVFAGAMIDFLVCQLHAHLVLRIRLRARRLVDVEGTVRRDVERRLMVDLGIMALSAALLSMAA